MEAARAASAVTWATLWPLAIAPASTAAAAAEAAAATAAAGVEPTAAILEELPTALRALKNSRPYFYLATLWLYVLPTGRHFDLLTSGWFWCGLLYCTLPLNLLCYLMNDLADTAVDASNPRKGGSLFGVRERSERLHALVPLAALLHLPFLLAFACRIGTLYTLSWLAAVLSVNWTYNFGPHLSSRYAPLDLFCPCGYLLVIPLSCALNMLPLPPLRCWIHTLFFVVRSQLWIQTFDVCCDARAGRRTSAVILGLRRSRILLALILVGETLFVYTQFYDWALRSFSFASIILLALQEMFGHSTGEEPSASAIDTTFAILGTAGFGLMVQVWFNGAFNE